MTLSSIIGLVNNAALLLAFSLIYEMFYDRPQVKENSVREILTGIVIGVIGIAMIMNPWKFIPGVVFDTSSVLLCISGLFLGTVPTLLAVLITGGFRLYLSGAGQWTGLAVIVTSGGIGLAWRYLRHKKKLDISSRELYFFGIVVHIAMLLCMFFMPLPVAKAILFKISFPVLLFFPLATALLGWLMINRGLHKQAERALRESEEALKASKKKYQSLFENAQVALFRNRLADGKILEINERYAKMAGYSTVKECMAEFNAADAWVDPNGRKNFVEILQRNRFVSDYETEIIRRDGTNIWISFSATIFPEQGFIEGSIVEITERKNSEIEREKLQAQLNQAQKMESVGRLAGGVAHDFNNMLSIILGNAEIIMEDIAPSNPIVTNVEEIYRAAERSANLTKQLLAFARKQTIDPKMQNLNNILDNMLKMLKHLIGENIDLTWRPSQKLRSVKIDSSQIDQILTNLCVNARDAIKSVGKVTIETDNISFDRAYCKEHAGFTIGDYVMMAVSDNGSGMDKKTLNNLFEPFFTTKEIGRGTGLGLATVYGIVKQNKGFINVYSEPGQGTTFKIYLPVHSETTISNQKDFTKTPLKGNETILLVEDEKAVLKMTRIMLERLGYKVLTASEPNEAVSIVKGSNINEIHLLMTDVIMPDMNGRDLSKKLLRMNPGLKCLFMSGYTANVIAHHGILDTGVQFINKPFSTQDLATKLREVLDEGK